MLDSLSGSVTFDRDVVPLVSSGSTHDPHPRIHFTGGDKVTVMEIRRGRFGCGAPNANAAVLCTVENPSWLVGNRWARKEASASGDCLFLPRAAAVRSSPHRPRGRALRASAWETPPGRPRAEPTDGPGKGADPGGLRLDLDMY